MKKPYCCEASRALYEDYYTKKSGWELPIFYGARTQRGYGIDSVLGCLFRFFYQNQRQVFVMNGFRHIGTTNYVVSA